MTSFEQDQTAELYFHTPGSRNRKAISYRRFATVAAAVSFVMNEVTPSDRNSCFLEFGERRLGYKDIKSLHQHQSYSHGETDGEKI